MAKHIFMYLRRAELRNVLDTLETGPFLSDFKYRIPIHTKWINICINYTGKLAITFTLLSFLAASACQTVSYVQQSNGENILPFGSLPILTEHFSFEIVIWYQSPIFFILAIGFTASDVIYASIISHICVQCKILQDFIKKTVKIGHTHMMKVAGFENVSCNLKTKPQNRHVYWNYIQGLLKEAVLFHMIILKISEQTENIFNIPVLVEFTSLSVTYCFIMFQMSLATIWDFRFIKYTILLTCAVFPLLLLSYYGNQLAFESQTIAKACYELDSVGIDLQFQKDLILIMQRSQKPVLLTVGKFFDLSLATMLSFCRAYFSYYMVVRKMNGG